MSPRWGSNIFRSRAAINRPSLTGLKLVPGKRPLKEEREAAKSRFPFLPLALAPSPSTARPRPKRSR